MLAWIMKQNGKKNLLRTWMFGLWDMRTLCITNSVFKYIAQSYSIFHIKTQKYNADINMVVHKIRAGQF